MQWHRKSWLSIALVILLVSGVVALFYLSKPSLLGDTKFSRAVYDEHGHLLRLTLSQDDKYRLYVPLGQISPQLIQATLLQEDQYFYWHFGVNPVALSKAVWKTYVLGQRRIGASTITMQLARLRFGIHSKSIHGKILQILRALQLEIFYSKQEILEAYLNLVPYGNNIEGAGAASLIYFAKPAKQLALSEALTLAIIPQNPTHRSPQANIPQLTMIRNKLFVRWLQEHPQDIDKKAAMGLPLQLLTIQNLPFLAPHFVNSILQTTPPNQNIIVTTLDVHLQKILEQVTRNYLMRTKDRGVYNATALLVDTRNMEVKALLGSADFFNLQIQGQVDGTLAQRSPGSALKPFIYALALDQGLIHPNTILKDVPHSFGSYNPENFDNDFMGPIKAKDALILSRNIPAIYLADKLRHPDLYDLLEQVGISNLKAADFYGLALVLGGAEVSMQELVSMYAMLANDGNFRTLRMRVDQPLSAAKPLLSPEASYLTLDMLRDAPRPDFIPTSANHQSLPVAWKTGTSSGYRDAWSVGVFGPYVLAVWIGNFDARANPAFVGRAIAAPLLFEIIDAIAAESHPLPIIVKHPEQLNLTHVLVCKASGMLPTRYCHDTELTWFIPGKSPIKTDTIYREIPIDKNTGLRACHFDNNTTFITYEFWPSDLLTIFKQAGIQRREPPPYNANCNLNEQANEGLAPQITSPQMGLSYTLRADAQKKELIPFTAVADADVANLYWFLNATYLGKSSRDRPLLWPANAGKFIVRVVDDHGRSDSRDLIVNMEQ